MGVFITFVQIEAVTLIVNACLIAFCIYLIRLKSFKKVKLSPQIIGYILLVPLVIAFLFNLYFCITMVSDFFSYKAYY